MNLANLAVSRSILPAADFVRASGELANAATSTDGNVLQVLEGFRPSRDWVDAARAYAQSLTNCLQKSLEHEALVAMSDDGGAWRDAAQGEGIQEWSSRIAHVMAFTLRENGGPDNGSFTRRWILEAISPDADRQGGL